MNLSWEFFLNFIILESMIYLETVHHEPWAGPCAFRPLYVGVP